MENDVEKELLSYIKIPDDVEHLEKERFKNYKKLSKIDLPKNLKSIGESCFENCLNLSKITIPRNVKKIGDKAFAGSNLKKIIFKGSIPKLGFLCFDIFKKDDDKHKLEIHLAKKDDFKRFSIEIKCWDENNKISNVITLRLDSLRLFNKDEVKKLEEKYRFKDKDNKEYGSIFLDNITILKDALLENVIILFPKSKLKKINNI